MALGGDAFFYERGTPVGAGGAIPPNAAGLVTLSSPTPLSLAPYLSLSLSLSLSLAILSLSLDRAASLPLSLSLSLSQSLSRSLDLSLSLPLSRNPLPVSRSLPNLAPGPRLLTDRGGRRHLPDVSSRARITKLTVTTLGALFP